MAGAKSRDGTLRLAIVQGRSRISLHGFIRRHVSDDAEAIYTDEWMPYRGIADGDTRHETINHHAGEWVVGDIHTNGVEST